MHRIGFILLTIALTAAACSGSEGDPVAPAERAVARAGDLVAEVGEQAWAALLLALDAGYDAGQVLEAVEDGRLRDTSGRIESSRGLDAEVPDGVPLDHFAAGPRVVLAGYGPRAHGEPIAIAVAAESVLRWARVKELTGRGAVVAAARILRFLADGYTPPQLLESILQGGSTSSLRFDDSGAAEPFDAVALVAAAATLEPSTAIQCDVLRDGLGKALLPPEPPQGVPQQCRDLVGQLRLAEQEEDEAGLARVYVGTASAFLQLHPNLPAGCQETGNPVTMVVWPSGAATLAIETASTIDGADLTCVAAPAPAVFRFAGFVVDDDAITMTGYSVTVTARIDDDRVSGTGAGLLDEANESVELEFDFVAARCPARDPEAGSPPGTSDGAPLFADC